MKDPTKMVSRTGISITSQVCMSDPWGEKDGKRNFTPRNP